MGVFRSISTGIAVVPVEIATQMHFPEVIIFIGITTKLPAHAIDLDQWPQTPLAWVASFKPKHRIIIERSKFWQL
ncbi:MAG: hypothetical protein ABFS56_18965, partial [Pseudomonadota bacterium]